MISQVLANHFLRQYWKSSMLAKSFLTKRFDRMNRYHWPGNVRELMNQIKRVVLMSDSVIIEDHQLDLPKQMMRQRRSLKSIRERLEREMCCWLFWNLMVVKYRWLLRNLSFCAQPCTDFHCWTNIALFLKVLVLERSMNRFYPVSVGFQEATAWCVAFLLLHRYNFQLRLAVGSWQLLADRLSYWTLGR